jgi:hypothetical protein
MGRAANQNGNDSSKFAVTGSRRINLIDNLRAWRGRTVHGPNSVPAGSARDAMRYSAGFPGLSAIATTAQGFDDTLISTMPRCSLDAVLRRAVGHGCSRSLSISVIAKAAVRPFHPPLC